MPATFDCIDALTLPASRPAAMNPTLNSRRYSQISRPVYPEAPYTRTGFMSHPHSAVDRQAGTVDEAGGVGGQEHDRVGHVGDLAQAARRREPDDGAHRLLRRREQAEPRDVVGQPRAHGGRHEPRVDAVHAYAVTELAGLH